MKTPFTYEVDLNTDDGGTEKVTFTIKNVTDIPVGVLRRHRGNQEAQMWATFEWGLSQDQMDNFDRLTADQAVEILNAWQESGNGDQDKPVGPPKMPADPDAPTE